MIDQRKKRHIELCLAGDVERGTTGLENYRFEPVEGASVDSAHVDLATTLLGKKIKAPLMISAMTGGTEQALQINRNLASAAEQFGIPLGLGSMRAAIEQPDLAYTYQVRKQAPTIPLLANLGLVQLNYGYSLAECRRAVELIKADALVFHFNPWQEKVSDDGTTDFSGLLPKLETIVRELDVPVIVKEVGCGLSGELIRQLHDVGVQIVDVAGRGGTCWPLIEARRTGNPAGEQLAAVGIPTVEALIAAKQVDGMSVIASGGIRTGLDVAKCLALGADLAGMALPLLAPATQSADEVAIVLSRVSSELRVELGGIGVTSLAGLSQSACLHPVV